MAFYIIFFDPRQRTPDLDYYTLVLGLFGLTFSFIVTLTVSARANQAAHYPLIVKLPSRIEYLSAVMVASLLYALTMQIVIASIALVLNGPDVTFRQMLDIPPLWIAGDVLFVIIALHASDLVAKGWSRVYVFTVLGILLYLQSGLGLIGDWLFGLFNRLGSAFAGRGLDALAGIFYDLATWFTSDGTQLIEDVFGIVFWPFDAIIDATIRGHFSPIQALAPSLILIYASLMFVLAAHFYSHKDLLLSE
jgi:hypothetical protein